MTVRSPNLLMAAVMVAASIAVVGASPAAASPTDAAFNASTGAPP